ncbi:MAG: IS1595 family transposase [Terriglobales bacterium]|jgi:transposase-like protein
MTLPELNQKFSTDEDCREILTRLRWPEGVECPRCKNRNVWWVDSRKQFTCSECSYQFSVTTGTIFNDSHLALPLWFMAVLLLCEAKKGMSALQLKRTIWGEHKGSYKTAWYLCHRIRAAMKEVDAPMLDGTIEMDETYVGGRKRGQGIKAAMNAKEVVIGIRQRSGDLRFFHASDASSGTLAKYIQENISEDVEVIVTDEWRGYKGAVGDFKHETVNHGAKEYARYENGACISTNTVESAFSLLKRGIIGSWHKISAKHLAAYLDEMTFRFNRRKRSDLFIDTLRHMVTAPTLTFDKLTMKAQTNHASETAVPF